MQEMIIPAGKAGLIIGKGGETIKQLQVTHAAFSYPDGDDYLFNQEKIASNTAFVRVQRSVVA